MRLSLMALLLASLMPLSSGCIAQTAVVSQGKKAYVVSGTIFGTTMYHCSAEKKHAGVLASQGGVKMRNPNEIVNRSSFPWPLLFGIFALAILNAGCTYVTSAQPTMANVNGDAWYVKTVTFLGIPKATEVYYCSKDQPTQCQEAQMQTSTPYFETNEGA